MSPNEPDDQSLNERLASARSADEVREILGTQRVGMYSVIFATITLGSFAVCAYLVVAVTAGSQGIWVLGWLLPPLFLLLFFGSISYADIYQRVTGRSPKTRGFIGLLDRLNTNI
jgi:hypothetical protein